MHWYGTISLTAEGKTGELKRLPKMARAYEETMRRMGDPSDCISVAGYFADSLEKAVAGLAGKENSETGKIEFEEFYDTAHVPVLAMHLACDMASQEMPSVRVILEGDIADSSSDNDEHYRLSYSPKTGRWHDRENLFWTMCFTGGFRNEWAKYQESFKSIYAEIV